MVGFGLFWFVLVFISSLVIAVTDGVKTLRVKARTGYLKLLVGWLVG